MLRFVKFPAEPQELRAERDPSSRLAQDDITYNYKSKSPEILLGAFKYRTTFAKHLYDKSRAPVVKRVHR